MDSRWFKQWKKYVGFDNWDMYNVGERSLYPGPIDNSGLFSGKSDIWTRLLERFLENLPLLRSHSCNFPRPKDQEKQVLKDHLIDELDYVLVPTEAWNKLVSWYSCLDVQRPIVRKVIRLFLTFVFRLILHLLHV